MTQSFSEIAKDITIAAIEKGIFIAPGRSSYENLDEMFKYNKIRAEEIGKLYKTIAKAVNDAMTSDFGTYHEQE